MRAQDLSFEGIVPMSPDRKSELKTAGAFEESFNGLPCADTDARISPKLQRVMTNQCEVFDLSDPVQRKAYATLRTRCVNGEVVFQWEEKIVHDTRLITYVDYFETSFAAAEVL